ncbi:MAG: ribonuclease III [Parcubacteria group bacterium]|nr:ribonuclease III [Parcubacteria group bacterium]
MAVKDISLLEKAIDYVFKNKQVIQEALTHRSYINEHPEIKYNNERLEFLGDAALELAITERLYTLYQTKAEGELTSLRASVVKTDTLAELARKLRLYEFLLLSKGESVGVESRDNILADVVEAIIGAIYLDGGYENVLEFIDRFIVKKIARVLKYNLQIDAKTQLQELVQEREKTTPIYKIVKESGPAHKKIFIAAAYVKDNIVGKGNGPSKQEAERQAAKNALKKLKKKV